MLPGIHHPQFTHLNDTHYLMSNLDNKYKWYVHVGQIMVFLAFDQHIRKHNGNISAFPGILARFIEFALAFNNRKYPNDPWRIALCIVNNKGEDISACSMPVKLEDFYIQLEQCGISPLKPKDTISEAHALIFEDYATLSTANNKKWWEHCQQQEAKRQHIFGCFGTARTSTGKESSSDMFSTVMAGFLSTPMGPKTLSNSAGFEDPLLNNTTTPGTSTVTPPTAITDPSAPFLSSSKCPIKFNCTNQIKEKLTSDQMREWTLPTEVPEGGCNTLKPSVKWDAISAQS